MSREYSLADMIAANAKAAKISSDMDEWARSFSNDIGTRYLKYGTRTFVSDKQEKHIRKIFNEHGISQINAVPEHPGHADEKGIWDDPNSDEIPF